MKRSIAILPLVFPVLLTLLAGSTGCASAIGETPLNRPRLILEPADAFACKGAEGELVVLVNPDWGAIVIAPESFAGSQQVGRIDDGSVYLSIPGLRMPEIRMQGRCDRPDHKTLWGRMVGRRGLAGKPGCGALERPENPKQLDERVEATTKRILAEGLEKPRP